MRNPSPLLRAAPLALVALLAACNSNSTAKTEASGESAEANTAEAAPLPPIELPPSLTASHTYRCKDNSILYIDFYGDKAADLRAKKDGSVTKLTAAEAGKPLEGEGYSVSGSGAQVNITQPGKGSQACKA
jgi:uncharacterized lipoprotein